MKKYILLIILLTLTFFSISAVYTENTGFIQTKMAAPVFNLQEKSRISIDDEKKILQKSKGNDVLVHNNGSPIRTNSLSKGHNLFAVYLGSVSGIEYESYIFSNQPGMRIAEIVSELNTLKRIMGSEIEKRPAHYTEAKPVYRNMSWTCSHWGEKAVRISSVIAFTKQTSNADVDGKGASIWDVSCPAVQVESFNRACIVSQYTWLNVNRPDQILFKWNCGFKAPGFAIKDMTSKAGKYGKWKVYTSNCNQRRLTAKPAIRVSNAKGDLTIKMRHRVTVTRLLSTRQSYTCDTGTQTFTFPDR